MWSLTAPTLYQILVLHKGWSVERFGAFISAALTATLIPPRP